MHALRCFAVLAALAAGHPPALAQYSWSTLVGLPPQPGSADGPAASARFNRPGGIVGSSTNNFYITDSYNATIRVLTAAGNVGTLAGSPGLFGTADGTGPNARFGQPNGIVIAGGVLFVTDRSGHTIRRVTSSGVVTTFAGRGATAGSADGVGSDARFNDPFGIVADASGNLFVTERLNHTIRKITPDGAVSTFAGAAGVTGAVDGPGAAARFNTPTGIDIDSSGNLYVAESGNHTVRKITPAGVVTTWVGTAGVAGTTNGTGTAARFSSPHGILTFGSGSFLLADWANHCIRFVTTAGVASLYAGRLAVEGSRDGALTDARFFYPEALAFGPEGSVVVADSLNHSIRKIESARDSVTTLAGPGGNFGKQDGIGPAARFNYPSGVFVHSSGDVYLADSRGNSIRRISRDGNAITVAGAPSGDNYIDGPAEVASLNYPVGVTVAPDRTIYFCEQQRHTIRVVRPDGAVATIAGAESAPGSTDGTGSAARFSLPSGIARDNEGNLFIADTNNHTIRRIATGSTAVTTFAGAAGVSGGADGTGAAARFSFPRGLCTDGEGNLFVADSFNHTIRKITPAGVVTTVAGLAGVSGGVNGTTGARFLFPYAVAVDASGQLYVAEFSNSTVRKITGNVVTTIGGSFGVPGFATGSTNNARFLGLSGIAVDASGVVYVSEAGNNIVSKGVPETAPAITAQPQSVTVPAGGTVTFSVSATGTDLAYQWLREGITIRGATAASYTITNVDASQAGSYTVQLTNNLGGVTSSAATLAIGSSSNAGRIVNLSILTSLPAAGDTFTMGFVVGGAGTQGAKPLVIRAVGPSLGTLGVSGTLDDPKLELFTGTTKSGENDNWGGSATLAAAMQGVGAFALSGPASRDAATSGNFALGDQSVRVSAAGNGTGTVIAEIYDATPADSFSATTPRLINVSVLKPLGIGLTAGFVIGGGSAKTVLVRAIGPTLGAAPFNVPGVVADPQLTLFSGQTVVASNDNWGGTPALVAAFAQVGAFPLTATSHDAAVVQTLPPGNYTVAVSGVGNTTGVALVEVYEVP